MSPGIHAGIIVSTDSQSSIHPTKSYSQDMMRQK